jgi:hypothetical protein
MTSFNSRFTSSIVLLAALSAALASPAFARGAAGAGGAGAAGSGGGGSGGGGTISVEARVAPVPPRQPVQVISPLFQAKYNGCQYDATGRFAWSPTNQPCPDTDY